MLYVIGLGLSDEKDITVRGLEAVRQCDEIYLEAYTSILGVDKEKLETYYGKSIQLADREFVESQVDDMLTLAKEKKVAFLVVGDVFGATTHTDLVLRAKEMHIQVECIHNASIMNAVGACGLQLYHFGPTVSIVFFTDTWKPSSFYDKVKVNRQLGFHTLCLLDIKVKEQSWENMARGRKIYEPPRFMTVNQAVSQFLEIEAMKGDKVFDENTIGVGMARVGAKDQKIIAGTLKELLEADFGPPLHSFLLPGKVHELEASMLRQYAVDPKTFDLHINDSEKCMLDHFA